LNIQQLQSQQLQSQQLQSQQLQRKMRRTLPSALPGWPLTSRTAGI
jgi:hypothetical protein